MALEFNQIGKPPEYLYYSTGVKKAVLVHIIRDGVCPCKYEELLHHFSDGKKIYKRLLI